MHKSQIDTSYLFSIAKKTNRRWIGNVTFYFKAWSVFRGVELNNFMNSFISCGMASPQTIDASDFAIRKVSFNPNKGRVSVMNLRSPVPVAGQTITVKVKCTVPFSEPIKRSVHF